MQWHNGPRIPTELLELEGAALQHAQDLALHDPDEAQRFVQRTKALRKASGEAFVRNNTWIGELGEKVDALLTDCRESIAQGKADAASQLLAEAELRLAFMEHLNESRKANLEESHRLVVAVNTGVVLGRVLLYARFHRASTRHRPQLAQYRRVCRRRRVSRRIRRAHSPSRDDPHPPSLRRERRA